MPTFFCLIPDKRDGELLTYNRLNVLGIDSVKITKIDKDNFKIDFVKIDSFDEFKKF